MQRFDYSLRVVRLIQLWKIQHVSVMNKDQRAPNVMRMASVLVEPILLGTSVTKVNQDIMVFLNPLNVIVMMKAH